MAADLDPNTNAISNRCDLHSTACLHAHSPAHAASDRYTAACLYPHSHPCPADAFDSHSVDEVPYRNADEIRHAYGHGEIFLWFADPVDSHAYDYIAAVSDPPSHECPYIHSGADLYRHPDAFHPHWLLRHPEGDLHAYSHADNYADADADIHANPHIDEYAYAYSDFHPHPDSDGNAGAAHIHADADSNGDTDTSDAYPDVYADADAYGDSRTSNPSTHGYVYAYTHADRDSGAALLRIPGRAGVDG